MRKGNINSAMKVVNRYDAKWDSSIKRTNFEAVKMKATTR